MLLPNFLISNSSLGRPLEVVPWLLIIGGPILAKKKPRRIRKNSWEIKLELTQTGDPWRWLRQVDLLFKCTGRVIGLMDIRKKLTHMTLFYRRKSQSPLIIMRAVKRNSLEAGWWSHLSWSTTDDRWILRPTAYIVGEWLQVVQVSFSFTEVHLGMIVISCRMINNLTCRGIC